MSQHFTCPPFPPTSSSPSQTMSQSFTFPPLAPTSSSPSPLSGNIFGNTFHKDGNISSFVVTNSPERRHNNNRKKRWTRSPATATSHGSTTLGKNRMFNGIPTDAATTNPFSNQPFTSSFGNTSQNDTHETAGDNTTVEKKVKEESNYQPDASQSPLPLTIVSRILKGIPQNPHFLPLKTTSQLAKKNLIIGWDKTFEETADQIQALTIEDFWARARQLWTTLQELNSLGYNVIVLRRRLVDLRDITMLMKFYKVEVLKLKKKVEIHRMEKSRLENEILKMKALVGREEASVEEAMVMVAKIEENLPVFDGVLLNLAVKPL